MRRAISPVIATVILIAITIIVGAAVAGWLLGLWGGLGEVEALRIYPDATLEVGKSNSTLRLTIKNEGTRDAKIMSITVEGVGTQSLKDPIIKAGATKTISVVFTNKTATPGASYLVKVMTEGGGIYQITVKAKEK
ncbi:MAG: type IV pilin [Acidilobaceae archaeon]|nr:type IV pilin [Acidilobaceae archaeon]